MKHLLWIGPRESDIADFYEDYYGSITIFGSNQAQNRSYSKIAGVRLDHNQPNCVPNSFWRDTLRDLIDQDPDLKIVCYDPSLIKSLPVFSQSKVIGCNSQSLLEFLASKSELRQLAAKIIPVVPFQKIDINSHDQLMQLDFKEGSEQYILQENQASGGYGTHIITKHDYRQVYEKLDKTKSYFLSPYMKSSLSVNVHCVLFAQDIVVLPGSIQLMKEVDKKILYLGADFPTFQTLPDKIKREIRENSRCLCECLQNMGYRGVLGIDFLVFHGNVLLLEVNGRFQASTVLVNKTLASSGLPSMQAMHLSSFNSNTCERKQELENLEIPYSMACYTRETWNKAPMLLNSERQLNEVVQIDLDGYHATEKVLPGAYLFRFVFQTNLSWVNADKELWIYENLYDIDDEFSQKILEKDSLAIKISLLNQGVQISQCAKTYLNQQGEIKNAVFSAVDLTILDGLQVNCPNDVKFISFTPWQIDLDVSGKLSLYYRAIKISDIALDMSDPHTKRRTKSGLLYGDASFWATDRLRIHHTPSCAFKKRDLGCRFCEVPKLTRSFTLTDVYEILDFYLENANTFRHFLIGGGSEPFDMESKHITKIAAYIRQRSSKPIYLMCLPPSELSVIDTWFQCGISEIAFNIELFDRVCAVRYMPGKGTIPLEQYLRALEYAASLWGKDGNVRTLFIAGLEGKRSLLDGIKTVCSMGVMPILSVFRPLKNTEMKDVVSPQNEWLLSLYHEAEEICEKYHLHLGPSCPSCQNNTLSLPFN